MSNTSVIFRRNSVREVAVHPPQKQEDDTKRHSSFEMRAGLRRRWEAVTGLCGASHPVKPTNVELMPQAGCSKTAIMKNTGEDNIKWLLYILQWRLADTKVGWQRHRRQRQALVLLIESLVKSSILAAWKVTVTDILLQTHTQFALPPSLFSTDTACLKRKITSSSFFQETPTCYRIFITRLATDRRAVCTSSDHLCTPTRHHCSNIYLEARAPVAVCLRVFWASLTPEGNMWFCWDPQLLAFILAQCRSVPGR